MIVLCYERSDQDCGYPNCDHTKDDDSFCCIRHYAYSCIVCIKRIVIDSQYSRCNVCERRNYYRCHKCLTSYKSKYMNITEHRCIKCDYHTFRSDRYTINVPVVGKYIKNVYNYKDYLIYPIKLHKQFSKPASDKFIQLLLSLPIDIILLILNLCSLQPSFITIEHLTNLNKIQDIILII